MPKLAQEPQRKALVEGPKRFFGRPSCDGSGRGEGEEKEEFFFLVKPMFDSL